MRQVHAADSQAFRALGEGRPISVSLQIIGTDPADPAGPLVAHIRPLHAPHRETAAVLADVQVPRFVLHGPAAVPSAEITAHAASRWAAAVVRLVTSPTDPRTVADWSRWIAASPGAIRNWCRTAGISSRRSLVFARLLRAVTVGAGGRHKPENLLDVVDKRTLIAMLDLAGLSADQPFPFTIEEFLDRQILVRDRDAVLAVLSALRRRPSATGTLQG